MIGFIKYFENGGKNMSFVTKDDDQLDKYNNIWDKIKEKLNIKFDNMPLYDKKYIKAKGTNCTVRTCFLLVIIFQKYFVYFQRCLMK